MEEQNNFGGKWQQKIVWFATLTLELVLSAQVLNCLTQCPVAAGLQQHWDKKSTHKICALLHSLPLADPRFLN